MNNEMSVFFYGKLFCNEQRHYVPLAYIALVNRNISHFDIKFRQQLLCGLHKERVIVSVTVTVLFCFAVSAPRATCLSSSKLALAFVVVSDN